MNQQFILPASVERVTMIERITKVLSNLPLKRWKVEISEAKPVRSNNQNRYLWGVCYPTILAAGRLEGWSAQDLHEYLLGEHFGWELVEGFGRKRQRPIRRSAKLTKLEFVDYTQFIQQRMSEHGIYVPDPNE
jgi:hypothetical protein